MDQNSSSVTVVLQNKNCVTVEELMEHSVSQSEHFAEKNSEQVLYECEICFETFKHCDGVQFHPCGHIFCKICTHRYYQTLAHGLIGKPFQCLSSGCPTEAPQALVREALSTIMFEKYEQSLLEVALNGICGVVGCPNEKCLKIACLTNNKLNLVQCAYCEFICCYVCKQRYHGVAPCELNREGIKHLIEEWNGADDEGKATIAKRFGNEKNVKSMIEQFQNETWIEQNCKNCPNCAASIEKVDGCHKMNCAKCNTNFCWLCNEKLTGDDPYAHFRANGGCEGRLFLEFDLEHHLDDYLADLEEPARQLLVHIIELLGRENFLRLENDDEAIFDALMGVRQHFNERELALLAEVLGEFPAEIPARDPDADFDGAVNLDIDQNNNEEEAGNQQE